MALNIQFADTQVCMLTRNEGLLLEANLLAMKQFFPRFAIVDQSSTDETVEIIRDVLGHRAIVKIEPEHYIREIGFAGARNKVSDLCTLPWILHVDADEALSIPDQKDRITSEFASSSEQFLAVERNNLGRSPSVELPITPEKIALLPVETKEAHVRLYRRGVGIRWHSFIHEELWQNGMRLPHGAPTCNILLNHLSRFKDFELRELKEEFYGWMLIKGFDQPKTKEDELSAYSLNALNSRPEYFRRMADKYNKRLSETT